MLIQPDLRLVFPPWNNKGKWIKNSNNCHRSQRRLIKRSKHPVPNVKHCILCIEKESMAGTQSHTICVLTASVANDGPNLVSRTRQCHSRMNLQIVVLLWLMYPLSAPIHHHPLAPLSTAANLQNKNHILVRWMLSQMTIFEWTITCSQKESGDERNSWIIPHGRLTFR